MGVKIREILSDPLLISIDLTRTPKQMVEAGRFNEINLNLRYTSNADLPIGTGIAIEKVVLAHFDRKMSTAEIKKEFKEMNLRPLSCLELLALGEQHPEEQREFPVVALKHTIRCNQDEYIPYLWVNHENKKRLLGLNLILDEDREWAPYCRFAAIKP